MNQPGLRVLFICQWYPPEPAAIPEGIARALTREGLHVEVLTGIPNYPSGVVADGYSALRGTFEMRQEIRVQRVPLYPSHDSSVMKRFANYATWAIAASILGFRSLRSADVALVYSSPATAALPAMVASRLWGKPYVLLVQDVWPDSIFASGFFPGTFGRLARRIINHYVESTYKMAEHVAAISPGMADLLAQRGVPQEKLSVVYNWVPEEELQEKSWPTPTLGHRSLASRVGVHQNNRIFLYAGNHGHAQALDYVVRAFLDDRTAPAHLVMLGDGVVKRDLVSLANEHPRVHFLDRVDPAEAAQLMVDADVSVISLADEPLFSVTMPSKVQYGLASATPMLVVARGDAASVVRDANAGAVAEPGDVDAVVEAVRKLADASPTELLEMGARGQRVYHSEMACAVGAPKLSWILGEAATRRKGPRAASDQTERVGNFS
ncbi:glycosyltransferase family 4 protein [Ornithinimicrobium flavum]|uniref:glycosyltransferase family 4 protein n=1 Tax=Ornithinimicrobium flavum TaxID=1288636 RepID=UPI0013053BCE|nr:glycosyltransferase family 4 protein [Ornithinimicrobium flavum]